ncbi:MAG TPA: hypothetical protein DIC57_06560 [Sphaerochaeta sp.]|jgi:hypothetical protein|nr:hypothetical protein [Sphaerochaeta sp.]
MKMGFLRRNDGEGAERTFSEEFQTQYCFGVLKSGYGDWIFIRIDEINSSNYMFPEKENVSVD